jgi:hypothetical protein
MKDKPYVRAVCGDCAAQLSRNWIHEKEPQPCARCGSLKKSIEVNLVDNLEFHHNERAKLRDPACSARKNPRIDSFSGYDLRKSDGRWIKKDRVIDKINNLYKEHIQDPKTGEIVRDVEEPLSDHVGHGSAKFKRVGCGE